MCSVGFALKGVDGSSLTVQGGCIQGSPSICMGSRRDVLWRESRGMSRIDKVGSRDREKGSKRGREDRVVKVRSDTPQSNERPVHTVPGQGQTLNPLFPWELFPDRPPLFKLTDPLYTHTLRVGLRFSCMPRWLEKHSMGEWLWWMLFQFCSRKILGAAWWTSERTTCECYFSATVTGAVDVNATKTSEIKPVSLNKGGTEHTFDRIHHNEVWETLLYRYYYPSDLMVTLAHWASLRPALFSPV